MCIRDRQYPEPRAVVGAHGRSRARVHRRSGEASSADPREAVSYTHLRAHETVLDLVCRLLLEKKKKKTKKNEQREERDKEHRVKM